MAEEDFAGWPEMRLSTLNIRDLPQGCAVIQWRQPQPIPAVLVGRFHDYLPAIPRNVKVEDLETSHQRFGAPRLQVGHHHFSGIPVVAEFVRLFLHYPVQELAAIGREDGIRGVSLERDLPVAAARRESIGKRLAARRR